MNKQIWTKRRPTAGAALSTTIIAVTVLSYLGLTLKIEPPIAAWAGA